MIDDTIKTILASQTDSDDAIVGDDLDDDEKEEDLDEELLKDVDEDDEETEEI